MEKKKISYRTGEKSLTPEQVRKLLEIIDEFTDLVFFKTALNCGMRRGDIVRLRWKDIDWEKWCISFEEMKKDRVHTVFLSEEMLMELKRLRNQNANEYYLFPGRSEKKRGKGHISSKTAYNKYQMYLRKAGIQQQDEFRPFHSLRSTCIKLCQRAGWKREEAAKHVGDTVRVIDEHYATPSEEEMKEAAKTR